MAERAVHVGYFRVKGYAEDESGDAPEKDKPDVDVKCPRCAARHLAFYFAEKRPEGASESIPFDIVPPGSDDASAGPPRRGAGMRSSSRESCAPRSRTST
jgi:hypothetical protein